MKKLLMAAVALTAMSATPALAQQVFTVNGTVAPVCNYAGGSINFGTIGVSTSGALSPNQTASSTGQTGFYCNGAGTTVTVAHAALSNGNNSPPTGFTGTIDFTPVVKIGGADVVVGNASAASFGARAGSLVVEARNLTTANATDKLLASATDGYSGSITLTLSANP